VVRAGESSASSTPSASPPRRAGPLPGASPTEHRRSVGATGTLADTILTIRNAAVADLAALLQAQYAAKLDVVMPARDLHAVGGNLRLIGVGGEPRLTPDGVSPAHTLLRPTAIADAGMADRGRHPGPVPARLRETHIDLYDVNINTWLGDDPGRLFLVRAQHDVLSVHPGEPARRPAGR
jgi:hypothetical protein